jgi:hypothetical protein
LESYTKITLREAKATRTALLTVVDALNFPPTTANAIGAKEYSSLQHRGWIAEFILGSITSDARAAVDTHGEYHMDDGILILLCLMQVQKCTLSSLQRQLYSPPSLTSPILETTSSAKQIMHARRLWRYHHHLPLDQYACSTQRMPNRRISPPGFPIEANLANEIW